MVETETNNVETQVTQSQTQQEQNAKSAPSVDDLMKQLAEANARADKNKLELDKALKENGTVKKALRAKQTAEEQEAEAKAEADKLRDEELENLRKELNHNKAVSAYKSIQNEKVVETLIEAVSESDHNAIAAIIENEKKAAVKAAQAEWLDSRPQANAGAYSSMTREQIMAIPDRQERLRAIAQNQSLFTGGN